MCQCMSYSIIVYHGMLFLTPLSDFDKGRARDSAGRPDDGRAGPLRGRVGAPSDPMTSRLRCGQKPDKERGHACCI